MFPLVFQQTYLLRCLFQKVIKETEEKIRIKKYRAQQKVGFLRGKVENQREGF
jgi:hypothetical protein